MERKGITCHWASSSSQHQVPRHPSLFSPGPAIHSVMQNVYKEGCEELETLSKLNRILTKVDDESLNNRCDGRMHDAWGPMSLPTSPTGQRESACRGNRHAASSNTPAGALSNLRSQSECIAVFSPALASGFSHPAGRIPCTTPLSTLSFAARHHPSSAWPSAVLFLELHTSCPTTDSYHHAQSPCM